MSNYHLTETWKILTLQAKKLVQTCAGPDVSLISLNLFHRVYIYIYVCMCVCVCVCPVRFLK